MQAHSITLTPEMTVNIHTMHMINQRHSSQRKSARLCVCVCEMEKNAPNLRMLSHWHKIKLKLTKRLMLKPRLMCALFVYFVAYLQRANMYSVPLSRSLALFLSDPHHFAVNSYTRCGAEAGENNSGACRLWNVLYPMCSRFGYTAHT